MDLERETETAAAAVEVQQSLRLRLMEKSKKKQQQLQLWVFGGALDLEAEAEAEAQEIEIRSTKPKPLPLPAIDFLRGLFRGRREAAELVSGALAGAMAKAVLAPLETVRTRMVVGVGSRSIPGAFAEIVSEAGWRGLWAGNAINMLRIVPTQAIELATFEAVKRSLEALQLQQLHHLHHTTSSNRRNTNSNSTNENDWTPGPSAGLLSLRDWALCHLSPVAVGGAAAGIVSTLACHPLEVLKDRLTIDRAAYPSLGAAVAKIHAEAGLGGFYAGLCPTLAGMLPYSTCYYFMYDAIKRSYCRARSKTTLSRPELLLVGALSGLTASTLSFPLEVARKRLMVGAIQGKCPAHMFAALSEVLREEGTAGLYRGWGASCLKVMPTSGITWMFYEAWKDILLADKQLPHF